MDEEVIVVKEWICVEDVELKVKRLKSLAFEEIAIYITLLNGLHNSCAHYLRYLKL